jgi:hypothetical protein
MPSDKQLCGALALLLAAAGVARGDGGTVRLSEQVGPYRVSVFTAPEPLRVGAADVSVFVQDSAGAAVAEARVRITLTPPGGNGAVLSAEATQEAATNKLLRAATLDLPAAGAWRLAVEVEGPRGSGRCAVDIEVGPPLPGWVEWWPWVAWPAVPVLLFALHQWLKVRGTARPATGRPAAPRCSTG